MDSLSTKAQQEQAKGFYQQILDKLENLPPDTPDWREALKNALDEIIQTAEKPPEKKEAWDFSHEKAQTVFAADDGIVIRPITPEDEPFFSGVRIQYSLVYKSAYITAKEKGGSLYLTEVSPPEVFYCIIEDAAENAPIGYLGIKDTSLDLWEIAIELDGGHTKRGFGPRSIRLFLNKLQRITGKAEYKAVVEVDNIPSQKCFEGLGARLVGLCDGVVLKTEEEQKCFEEKNLDLINAHMVGLADRLGVEPRTLLSHVIEYRLTCPL